MGPGIVAGRVLQMAAGRISGKARSSRLWGRVQTAAAAARSRLAASLIRRHSQFHLNRLTAARRYLNRSAQGIVNGSNQAGYVVFCYLPVAVEVVQGEREFLPSSVALRYRNVAFEFLQCRQILYHDLSSWIGSKIMFERSILCRRIFVKFILKHSNAVREIFVICYNVNNFFITF